MFSGYWLIGSACGFVSAVATPSFSQEEADERDEALQPPQVFMNPAEADYSTRRRHLQGIPGIERAWNGRL